MMMIHQRIQEPRRDPRASMLMVLQITPAGIITIKEVTVEAGVAPDPEVAALLVEKGSPGVVSPATAVDHIVHHNGTGIMVTVPVTVTATVIEIVTLTPPTEDPGLDDPIDLLVAVDPTVPVPEESSIIITPVMVMTRIVTDPNLIKQITIMNMITEIIGGEIETQPPHTHIRTNIFPDPPTNIENNIHPSLTLTNRFFPNSFMKRKWNRKETHKDAIMIMWLMLMLVILLPLIQTQNHPPTK